MCELAGQAFMQPSCHHRNSQRGNRCRQQDLRKIRMDRSDYSTKAPRTPRISDSHGRCKGLVSFSIFRSHHRQRTWLETMAFWGADGESAFLSYMILSYMRFCLKQHRGDPTAGSVNLVHGEDPCTKNWAICRSRLFRMVADNSSILGLFGDTISLGNCASTVRQVEIGRQKFRV